MNRRRSEKSRETRSPSFLLEDLKECYPVSLYKFALKIPVKANRLTSNVPFLSPLSLPPSLFRVSLSVWVCVREREREKERVCVIVGV